MPLEILENQKKTDHDKEEWKDLKFVNEFANVRFYMPYTYNTLDKYIKTYGRNGTTAII